MKAKGGVPLSGAELLAIVQEDINPVVQTLVDTASTVIISKSPIATQPVVKATITKVKPVIVKTLEAAITVAIQKLLQA